MDDINQEYGLDITLSESTPKEIINQTHYSGIQNI